MTDTANDWDETPAEAAAPAEETKRVKCVVHTRPHTHEKALKHGEEADVPVSVAALMLKKGQVELA